MGAGGINNDMSGGSSGAQGGFLNLAGLVPVLGQVQAGIGLVQNLTTMFGGGSGHSTWSSQAHKDWVTQYVTNEGLAWADANAPQHRGNYPMSIDAQGVFYALKGWGPKPGDPHAGRYEQIRQAMQQGLDAASATGSLSGTNAGQQTTTNNSVGGPKSVSMWRWVWPWEKDAFKIAAWYTIVLWAIIFLVVPIWVIWAIAKGSKRRSRRRSKRAVKRAVRRNKYQSNGRR